jgi:phosphopantetheinyl transferase (holo-ACP synthase)
MGVDAERIGGVGDDLLPRLFDDQERARLMAMGVDERRVAATLGFSAKEACFKAWGARFRDLHIEWGDGVFRTDRGEGRFVVQDGLALTLIALPV